MNPNDYVWVKFTERGDELVTQHYAGINARHTARMLRSGRVPSAAFERPQPGPHGYIKAQFHDVMHWLNGEWRGLGCDILILDMQLKEPKPT